MRLQSLHLQSWLPWLLLTAGFVAFVATGDGDYSSYEPDSPTSLEPDGSGAGTVTASF